MAERLLRRPEVEARTGLARSTIYDYLARGVFPSPVSIGPRIVAWRSSDIDDWIEKRVPRHVEPCGRNA